MCLVHLESLMKESSKQKNQRVAETIFRGAAIKDSLAVISRSVASSWNLQDCVHSIDRDHGDYCLASSRISTSHLS